PSDPTGTSTLPGVAGTYFGDIAMEGWQGLTMIEEIDNQAAVLLGRLTTTDGSALEGVASIATAIDYAYDSPLRIFPAEVAVAETKTATSAELEGRYFPRPTSFTIAAGASRLAVLNGLIGGYAQAFAFTDASNPGIGGTLPFLVTFDGDPFPAD